MSPSHTGHKWEGLPLPSRPPTWAWPAMCPLGLSPVARVGVPLWCTQRPQVIGHLLAPTTPTAISGAGRLRGLCPVRGSGSQAGWGPTLHGEDPAPPGSIPRPAPYLQLPEPPHFLTDPPHFLRDQREACTDQGSRAQTAFLPPQPPFTGHAATSLALFTWPRQKACPLYMGDSGSSPGRATCSQPAVITEDSHLLQGGPLHTWLGSRACG